MERQEDQTEGQTESLVERYESMKRKGAARIFEEMDLAVLMPVVERMKERKTAPILAKMSPVKATAIITRLAQRRKPPTPEKLRDHPRGLHTPTAQSFGDGDRLAMGKYLLAK